ncbi:MAG: hypothetical protein HIU57_06730 [Acidobacteria bacterium]|nr:hypothetical protein [Acidobacteriota bacterium]
MRKFIPHALLATMTVLAIVAMVLSISSAERISHFAAPRAGSPAVVAKYRAVVQRTLDAPSFVYEQFLNYQAPDSTSVATSGGNDLVVGRQVYLPLASVGSSPRWGRGPLTKLADDYYGPTRALTQLRTFLKITAVVSSGRDFVVQQVLPADVVSPGNPGQVLVTSTVAVSGGYVTSISSNVSGWFSYPYAGTASHPLYKRVDTLTAQPVTYGNFGAVAPITAPPASQTVPLRVCGQGYQIIESGHHVCSVVGGPAASAA